MWSRAYETKTILYNHLYNLQQFLCMNSLEVCLKLLLLQIHICSGVAYAGVCTSVDYIPRFCAFRPFPERPGCSEGLEPVVWQPLMRWAGKPPSALILRTEGELGHIRHCQVTYRDWVYIRPCQVTYEVGHDSVITKYGNMFYSS